MHQKVDTYFKICQIQDPIVIPIFNSQLSTLKEQKILFGMIYLVINSVNFES